MDKSGLLPLFWFWQHVLYLVVLAHNDVLIEAGGQKKPQYENAFASMRSSRLTNPSPKPLTLISYPRKRPQYPHGSRRISVRPVGLSFLQGIRLFGAPGASVDQVEVQIAC